MTLRPLPVNTSMAHQMQRVGSSDAFQARRTASYAGPLIPGHCQPRSSPTADLPYSLNTIQLAVQRAFQVESFSVSIHAILEI